MCRLSWNLRALTSWNPLGLSRLVMELLYSSSGIAFNIVRSTKSINQWFRAIIWLSSFQHRFLIRAWNPIWHSLEHILRTSVCLLSWISGPFFINCHKSKTVYKFPSVSVHPNMTSKAKIYLEGRPWLQNEKAKTSVSLPTHIQLQTNHRCTAHLTPT
jgi:uncharacterized membrane protein